MDSEISLAPVPFANLQIQEEIDARLIREPELTPRSPMLDYSNSLLRREDGFLLERNVLQAFFLGPYLFSNRFSHRLTNPQLESENPSFLYRASKFLSENQISSILSVTCLTALPSAIACASSVTEDLAKYREDLCYSYLFTSVGVASIFTVITFAAPTIQRYLNNGDEFLLRLRQYRGNLGRNVNEINAPNNDGNQAPAPIAPVSDPASAPASASDPAREQVQAQAGSASAQRNLEISGQLVFFNGETPAQSQSPSPSLRNDAQDDGRVADNNDLVQQVAQEVLRSAEFSLGVLHSVAEGFLRFATGQSQSISSSPAEQTGNGSPAQGQLVFVSRVPPSATQPSERPSDEISSIGAQSFQGSPRNPGPDRV